MGGTNAANGFVPPLSSGKNITCKCRPPARSSSVCPPSCAASRAARAWLADSTWLWLIPVRGVRQVGQAKKLRATIFSLHCVQIQWVQGKQKRSSLVHSIQIGHELSSSTNADSSMRLVCRVSSIRKERRSLYLYASSKEGVFGDIQPIKDGA